MTAPNPEGDVQAFEAHPYLAAHVLRMARTGSTGTMWEWNEFLLSLNAALSAAPAALQPSPEGVRDAASFLLDRLTDFENRISTDEDAREFHGHVAPAAARLRDALYARQQAATGRERGEAETCPICDVAFRPDDLCAEDITDGACHAACLEGSPVVDLNTGEPTEDPASTFRYDAEETTLIAGTVHNPERARG